MWQQWVNLVLGLWVAIAPYAGMSDSALRTNFIVTGLAIAILALWGALEKSMSSSETWTGRNA